MESRRGTPRTYPAPANGHLRHVFTEIPNATTLEHIEDLLPHRIAPAQIKSNVNG